jgi:hypothetical protein
MFAYLGGGNGPDLVVIGTHKQVGDTSTHHTDDPLVEVLGLGAGNASLHGSIDHAVNALDLLSLGQHGDVVLEGVGDPLLLAADVRDTLVGVPVVLLRESLIDAVIEVLVVGEDNVTTNIVQLERTKEDSSQRLFGFAGRKRSSRAGTGKVNIRSPQGSHRWKQDHRGSR